MKNFFFAQSYPSLPVLLSLIKEGDTVIVASKNLLDFFELYKRENEKNFGILSCDFNTNGIYKKNWYKIPFDWFKSRRFYKNELSKVKNENVYFFSTAYTLTFFYFIKKMSKNNRIFYCKDKFDKKIKEDEHTKFYILRTLIYWMFNIDVFLYPTEGTQYPRVKKKFFDECKIETVEIAPLNDIYKIKMNIPKEKEVLLLTDDFPAFHLSDEKTFTDDMNVLYDILADFNYVIKTHPDGRCLYGKMAQNKDFIDSYIPAEFVLGHKWKFIIGICSTVLMRAEKGTKSIALIKCIRWSSDEERMKPLNWLQKYGPNVIIPENFDELRNLLKDVKEKNQ